MQTMPWYRYPVTACALALAALIPTTAVGDDDQPPTVTSTGTTHNISNNFGSTNVYEFSGLGLAKQGTNLWSITDENPNVYKMQLNGADSYVLTGSGSTDYEGITFGPAFTDGDDHYVYIVNEGAAAIVPVNYSDPTHPVWKTPVALSSMSGYSSPVPINEVVFGSDYNDKIGSGGFVGLSCCASSACSSFLTPCQTTLESIMTASSSNDRLEGITWDGSAFYVLKEKKPGLIIKITYDFSGSTAYWTIAEWRVLSWSGEDYSGITYDSDRGKFWITSDSGQRLYLYDWASNAVEGTYGLGYPNAEGVAYSPDLNQLYIVTDNGQGTDSILYTYNVANP